MRQSADAGDELLIGRGIAPCPRRTIDFPRGQGSPLDPICRIFEQKETNQIATVTVIAGLVSLTPPGIGTEVLQCGGAVGKVALPPNPASSWEACDYRRDHSGSHLSAIAEAGRWPEAVDSSDGQRPARQGLP